MKAANKGAAALGPCLLAIARDPESDEATAGALILADTVLLIRKALRKK